MSPSKGNEVEDPERKAKELARQLALAVGPEAREGFIRLFSPLELGKYRLSNATRNPERDMYVQRVLEQLDASGPWRRSSFPEDTLEKLEQLKPKVGNFAHVVERVIDAISLSLRYRKPIQITPILVVGEPGIGKSYFSHLFAESLGVPLRRIPMDNLQAGASLAGSASIYLNSEAGTVFKVLTLENHISPVIILDEIDKADGGSTYSDPLGPLHNLLEPGSARFFEDASCDLRIDASHVIWIATANHLDKIPATIRSRFEVFEIRSHSHGGRLGILKGICEELSREYCGAEFEEELVGELMERTPREQNQMLRRALARASRLGESRVTIAHLEQTTSEKYGRAGGRSIGFRGLAG